MGKLLQNEKMKSSNGCWKGIREQPSRGNVRLPFELALTLVEDVSSDVSVVRINVNFKILLLSTAGQDTILQGALPLVLDALDLVVCAKHDLTF